MFQARPDPVRRTIHWRFAPCGRGTPWTAAPRSGPCAMPDPEPRQGRKAAAL